MSLYGDLPQAKNSAGETVPTGHGPGWSNLMPPPALKKAPAAAGPAFKPPPSVLRAAAAGGAGGPGRGMPARGIPITGRTGGRGPPNTPLSDGPTGAAAGAGSAGAGSGSGAGSGPLSSGPVAMDVSGAAGSAASGSSVQPGVVSGPGAGPAQRLGTGGAGAGAAAGAGGGGSSIFTRHDGRPIEDEYDPMRPNDYEEVMAARERARKAAEAEAERLAKLKEEAEERERQRKLEEERARSAAAAGSSTGGSSGGVMSMEEYNRRRAAMGMTGDDAFARRAAATGAAAAAAMGGGGGGGGGGFGAMGPPGDEGPAGPRKGMGLAQKLLEKMGWKEGEGLGKNRQGISNPLIAQKTNQRAAVIVEAAPNPNASRAVAEPDSKRPRVGATLTGAPSRVICMRNMVGPGQVDEELEDEVGQELTKYGKVLDVLIFEVTTPGYPEEEAVRIFVQFERQESATKAAVDLQGRFFAGRSVRVSFFPEERFTSTDLAPKQGEFD